ncbi:uncharacterized protein LOC127095791 [Lathyrus oleraceus]|uniref:uncharacterized protein LOC127095791 n=1 Tax=Pisum sativum TaxID=3888 RepID=UPI0021D01B9E|nr:uncharacterized protein LOC127095791 [Pisum sativum]
MTCIADFFGVPQPLQPPQREWIRENQGLAIVDDFTINQVPRNAPQANVVNQGTEVEPPKVKAPRAEQQIPREMEPRVVMVNRHQNADEFVQQIQRNDMAVDNNLVAMVERIMARNGVDVGLHRPNYTSPLSEYVLQSELPARWKVPKFTKFSKDTSELTVEHVARYLIEAEEIANNENLRIKYFPSSLTKNAFTWFTTLPANTIDTWTRLERLFHEQFYMGQSKIILKELANIKRNFIELIDDYLKRFRLLKARCFTQVERLKADKARANKNNRKDRIAYVELGNDEPETYGEQVDFDEGEVDLAELKDLVQSAIRDERLKFGDKSKALMRIDVDPLQTADGHYTESSMVNMVGVSEYSGEKADMVNVADDFKQETTKGVTKDPHQMFPT